MHIHKEGYSSIGITFVALLIIDIIFWVTLPANALTWVITILSVLIFLWIVSFFRVPHREPTLDEQCVVAPADGTVVVIEETFEPEYFKDERIQVSIFMSPLNVHANSNPVSGEVLLSAYHPGKYLVAWNPKSSTLNERHTNVIRNEENGDILVRQIAGAMARRIVNYLKPGMKVQQSGSLGFIKFGSRVDLLLPVDADIQVKLNDKVKGRQSIIARLPK